MKFITIQNQAGETVAINPKRITSITKEAHGAIVICLGSQEFVYTQFTSIQAAVEYVEWTYEDRQRSYPIKWENDL